MLSRLELAVAYATALAMMSLLAALFVRRLYRIAIAFTIYIATMVGCNVLITTWQGLFFNWPFWYREQAALGIEKTVLALELSSYVFDGLPGARTQARRMLLAGAVAVVLIGGALTVQLAGNEMRVMATTVFSSVANGLGILFIVLWGLTVWYRVPVHSLHRAIIRGLSLYSLQYAVTYGSMRRLGWGSRSILGLIDNGVFLALIAYWVWVAWCSRPVIALERLARPGK